MKNSTLARKQYIKEYITDSHGKKIGVVLEMEKYHELLEDMQDLALIAERKDDDFVPFTEIAQKWGKRMAKYDLLISRKAIKEAEKIDKLYLSKIHRSIVNLQEDPLPSGVKKLAGSRHSYRIRVGDYRIIYTVIARTVSIMSILHRKDAYR